MPKRSALAIFSPELESSLFVAAPPLCFEAQSGRELSSGLRSLPTGVGDVVVERVACWMAWTACCLVQLRTRAPKP